MDFLFIPIRDAQSTGSLEPSWYKNKTEMHNSSFYTVSDLCQNMHKYAKAMFT